MPVISLTNIRFFFFNDIFHIVKNVSVRGVSIAVNEIIDHVRTHSDLTDGEVSLLCPELYVNSLV